MNTDSYPPRRRFHFTFHAPRFTLLGCLALLLPGCVPSLNPLYTEKDLVFDPALIGVWSEPSADKEQWAFEKSGDKEYKLLQTDSKGHTAEFAAHLLKLHGHLFLDLLPTQLDPETEQINQYAAFSLVPAHLFLKVTQVEPKLRMALLSPDWIESLLEKDPKALAHKKIGANNHPGTVLTAETKELQAFILKHLDDPKMFGDQSEMARKKPIPAQDQK